MDKRSLLLELAERAFAGAGEGAHPPAGYSHDWMHLGDTWEEMEAYLVEHPSVADVDFPVGGATYPPVWAASRVAASICLLILTHRDIHVEDYRRVEICADFVDAYLSSAGQGTPYDVLPPAQWEVLFATYAWGVSDEGPLRLLVDDPDKCLRKLRSALPVIALQHALSGFASKDCADVVWGAYKE